MDIDQDHVIFGMASPRNVSFHYLHEDSGFTKREWAELTKAEQDNVLWDYLNEQVQIWVEDE